MSTSSGTASQSFPPEVSYHTSFNYFLDEASFHDMSLKCVCSFSYQTESFHVSYHFPSIKAFASSSLLQNELKLECPCSNCSKARSYRNIRAPRRFVESPQICGIWGILLYFTVSSDLFSLEEFGYSLYGCVWTIFWISMRRLVQLSLSSDISGTSTI